MKTKYFLLGFMILSIFAFSASVKAADYAVGVAEDDVYIWKVKTWDIPAYADYFDMKEGDVEDMLVDEFDTKDLVGLMMQITITKIEEDEPDDDIVKITYDMWDHTDDKDDFEDDADDEDLVEYLYLDPDDLGDDVSVFGLGYFIPTKVADYLAAADWADDTEVSGTTVTTTIDKDDGPPDIEGDLIYIFKFNNKGGYSGGKMTTEDNEVLVESILMGNVLPGYELPILLGVAAVGTIGLVYIVMKKK